MLIDTLLSFVMQRVTMLEGFVWGMSYCVLCQYLTPEVMCQEGLVINMKCCVTAF